MAENLANRKKELSDIYRDVLASVGTFAHFLRSKLTKDVLKKCNVTAVDLRYVTIETGTQLYSFGEHWQVGTDDAHVYSTRFDDPVPLPKTATDFGGVDETTCARLFVTTKPIRVLSVQRTSVLELCKRWVREYYGAAEDATGNGATNGEESSNAVSDDSADMPPAMPRNIFQRKEGMSFLDYVLQHEHSDFHSIEGVAYDEPATASSTSPPSRHLLLFSIQAACLLQELVYPAKKKLRRGADGFLSCVSEPSRPQAPPMKRGKSVNTPPLSSHSPGGPPPPPPPYQPKTPPHPTPRPGTPTMTDEKGAAKTPPSKPQAAPRETAHSKETTPTKVPAPPKDRPNENAANEDDIGTQM